MRTKEFVLQILAVVAVVMPMTIKRFIYRKAFRYEIDESCSIGFSLILVDSLKMSTNARIGHFNVVKALGEVVLKQDAVIADLNWISAYPSGKKESFGHRQRRTRLTLGSGSAITSRHLLDCTDEIKVGAYSTIAGYRSQLVTHSIDLARNIQDCEPIVIGDYCFIGTSVVINRGCKIADQIVVGAGAVVCSDLNMEGYLYGGVPAKPIKKYTTPLEYFKRTIGRVK